MMHPAPFARPPRSIRSCPAKNRKTSSVKPRRLPLALEVLEERTVLSGTVKLSNGLLAITGTGNDTVVVQQIPGSNKNQPNQISVTLDGQTSTFKVTLVTQIQAQLSGSGDTFTLDNSNLPVTPPVFVNYGTGTTNNTVIVNGTNPVAANGTTGADSFTITSTMVGLTAAGTVAGTLTYKNAQFLTVKGLGGPDTFSMTSINSATATTLDGGTGTDGFTDTFASDFSGSLTLASIESATVTVPGTVTSGSSITGITGTNFSSVTVGTLAGTLLASVGSITGASISTVASTGVLKATEATGVAGSGVLSGSSIGSVSGMVFAGSIVNTTIGSVAQGGVVTAQGQGTTSGVSIGNLSGSFTAPEDSTPGSGVMSNTTIGTVTSTGMVSTGSISGMSVGTAMGSITAAGQGTTSGVSIGNLSGSFTAPEDSTPGSGTMSNTTIGTVTSTGMVSTGSISGMSVSSAAGSITAAGQGTTSGVSIGNLSGSFTAPEDSTPGSGTMSNTTITSITSTGTVSTGSISGMSVGTADSGSSITAAGLGTATNFTATTFGGALTVKADSTPGSGILNNAAIGTLLSTATLTAGHFNIVTVKHTAPVVNFIEQPFGAQAVTRTLAVTPHLGGAIPDYAFYYDGTTSGDPRVVVQIVGGTSANFDLGVTTSTPTLSPSGFDLAGLYSNTANMATGVHNVVIGGNLLFGPNQVPPGAVSFFNLPVNTPGGVQLPQDTFAVAAAGNLPAASIVAKNVPAVAAGSFAGVSADAAGSTDARVPLAASTGVTQANDTFQVFVSVANHVAQFLVTGLGTSFDSKGMLFAQLSPNVAAPVPVTASDTLVPSGSSTSVQSVAFTGQGGSLTTAQPIITSISAAPGGTLGDLILSSPGGITANITADSIIGNIAATNGGISGVIKTTVGDLGRALIGANGNITKVTTIQAGGGGLTATGQILARGNLVSLVTIKSGVDGVVAADGDLGVIQTVNGVAKLNPDGSLIRFGGITVSTGGLNGQVIVQGNAFGDISVTGGLSGRIAVRGTPGEFGLSPSRFGILGNVAIGGGISATGAIASDGVIGDSAGGTQLTISGTDKGLLAAGEDINFGPTGSIQGSTFENVATPGSPQYAGGANIAAIDAIFTSNGSQLDVTDPTQLSVLRTNLSNLRVDSNGNLTDAPPSP
jgi:hypothetical protein